MNEEILRLQIEINELYNKILYNQVRMGNARILVNHKNRQKILKRRKVVL